MMVPWRCPTHDRHSPRPLRCLLPARRRAPSLHRAASRCCAGQIRHAAAMTAMEDLRGLHSCGHLGAAYPKPPGTRSPRCSTRRPRWAGPIAAAHLISGGRFVGATTPGGALSSWECFSPGVVFDEAGCLLVIRFSWAGWPTSEATIRAGDWLVSIQDPSGAWQAHQCRAWKVIDTGGLGLAGALPTHRQARACGDGAYRVGTAAPEHSVGCQVHARASADPRPLPSAIRLRAAESGCCWRTEPSSANYYGGCLAAPAGKMCIPATFDATWRPTSR